MSSTSGLSPGGQGANIQKTQTEIEASAWAEMTKKFWLAILPADSLEVIPFTQQTYNQKFHYDASASKPTLTLLEQLRVSVPPQTVSAEGWTAVYDDLVKQLAEKYPKLSKGLQELPTIPFDKRDSDLVALNNVLVLIAKGVAWVDSTNHPIDSSTSAAMLYQMYLALPFIAMRGSITIGESAISSIDKLLQDEGPNHPLYDQAIGISNDMKKIVSWLNTLRTQLESGNTTVNVNAQLHRLERALKMAQEKIASSGLGNQLQIMNIMMEALSTVLSALALSSGSNSLSLSMELVTQGLSSVQSSAGLFGQHSHVLLESLLKSALDLVESGPRSDIKDMQALRDELNNFRDGG